MVSCAQSERLLHPWGGVSFVRRSCRRDCRVSRGSCRSGIATNVVAFSVGISTVCSRVSKFVNLGGFDEGEFRLHCAFVLSCLRRGKKRREVVVSIAFIWVE